MIVDYGLLCEDVAQKVFLECFLEKFKDLSFQFNEKFYYRFRASINNNIHVKKSIPQIGFEVFEQYQLKLLFIGLDYDSKNQKYFITELEKLYEKVDANVRVQSIIFYPVQAIEHWLLYLKYRKDKPKSTKNISFENKNRKNAKKDIFKSKKVSEAKTTKIISELMKEADLNWLKSRSVSFKYFYNDFNKYLLNRKKI